MVSLPAAALKKLGTGDLQTASAGRPADVSPALLAEIERRSPLGGLRAADDLHRLRRA
ncbi:MAG TPA: hypothetical protein VMV10_14750 [Pirellulales bacterium]|nr:hypothetical protein [Pirellulales bacterium]